MTSDPAPDPRSAEEAGWRTDITWIVLHPDRSAVVVINAHGSVALPRSVLPGRVWLGDAPVLTAAVAGLGLDAVLLGCRERIDDLPAQRQRLSVLVTPRPGSAAAAATTRSKAAGPEETALPPGMRWVGLNEVGDLPPADTAHRSAGRPPWEDPAWFRTTERWLRERLEDLGRPIIGRVQQHRVWELSTLLRAETSTGAVWLKASAESTLFADEGAVMALLADWFPTRVPAPLAVDAERRLLLLEDLGPELGRRAPIELQEEMLVRFAELQAATVGRLDTLRAAGLLDRSPRQLAEQVTAWFADLDATAQLPGLDPLTWLTADEASTLQAALPRLLASCQELAVGPVPVTLLHGDLHMGNVAVGSHGPLLYDWTDACLGHPFFDLITALHGTDGTRVRLRDAYLSGWADHAAPDELVETWQAAEILAPLHHALSYRAIAAACAPPVDPDMASGTAFWLRSLLTALNAIA